MQSNSASPKENPSGDPRARVKALARKIKEQQPALKHGQCLEMVSIILGFPGWHVLSALINRNPEQITKVLDEKENAF